MCVQGAYIYVCVRVHVCVCVRVRPRVLASSRETAVLVKVQACEQRVQHLQGASS